MAPCREDWSPPESVKVVFHNGEESEFLRATPERRAAGDLSKACFMALGFFSSHAKALKLSHNPRDVDRAGHLEFFAASMREALAKSDGRAQ